MTHEELAQLIAKGEEEATGDAVRDAKPRRRHDEAQYTVLNPTKPLLNHKP